jgi:hypothetical protein
LAVRFDSGNDGVSIHAPRVGSDERCRRAVNGVPGFNPRSPCGERHHFAANTLCQWLVSIHAPRVGSDDPGWGDFKYRIGVSIHAPRVGSDIPSSICSSPCGDVSIHAPRVGSDGLQPAPYPVNNPGFNPRSPCGERQTPIQMCFKCVGFQSTLPVWGATCRRNQANASRDCFNPRSPCGERHDKAMIGWRLFEVSIHAPRVGSDAQCSAASGSKLWSFNPRSPCGERHNLRTIIPLGLGFNPRSPCGERLAPPGTGKSHWLEFQSTLPVWGATISSLPKITAPE